MLDDVMNMEIRYLGDLHKIHLKDGDVLVIQSAKALSQKDMEDIKKVLEDDIFKNNKVLVIDDGMRLGVVSTE